MRICPEIGWTHVKISHYYYRVHSLHITICSRSVISHTFIFGLLDAEKKDIMILGDFGSSSPSEIVEHPKTLISVTTLAMDLILDRINEHGLILNMYAAGSSELLEHVYQSTLCHIL